MRNTLKRRWVELRKLRPGERFQTRYRKAHEQRTNRHIGALVLVFLGAAVAFAIGVVLVFVPGPAVLFFLITGALLSGESMTVARWLDRGEVKARALFAIVRGFWRRRSPVGKVAFLSALAVVAASCVAGGWMLLAGRK